ncbi:MAG: 30S ribosomal protein S20 [Planctomycetota bacterium]
MKNVPREGINLIWRILLMAWTLSAKKNIRKTKKRNVQNKSVKSAAKTQIKKVIAAVESKDFENATKELSLACKKLDKTGKIRAFHPGKVDRIKSRLSKKVMAIKPAAVTS